MNSAGEISLGFFVTLFAGVLNGSWNAAFSPHWNLAVSDNDEKTSVPDAGEEHGTSSSHERDDDDLDYHLAFALFQVYAVLLNLVVCLLWAGGPSNISAVLAEASPKDIGLISLFGFLWGLGSLGFGLACKVAGVGVGTNLTMGGIVVLGTFLPLCYEGVLWSGGDEETAGWVIVGGLAVCVVGLLLSTWSLLCRDADEQEHNDVPGHSSTNDRKDDNGVTTQERAVGGDASDITNPAVVVSHAFRADRGKDDSNDPTTTTSTWHKIAICMGASILATQLQFAFVFGQNIIDLADVREETPESGAAAIVWLFAITIGAPPIVIYMLYYTQRRWWTVRFWRTVSIGRHLKLIGSTSVPWVAHIHLYGLVSNTLLPEKLGSSIAWPLLMMTTVAQGMILSLYLGEWQHASRRTRRILWCGLGWSAAGMGVLIASATVS